jgi:hypothetical protein
MPVGEQFDRTQVRAAQRAGMGLRVLELAGVDARGAAARDPRTPPSTTRCGRFATSPRRSCSTAPRRWPATDRSPTRRRRHGPPASRRPTRSSPRHPTRRAGRHGDEALLRATDLPSDVVARCHALAALTELPLAGIDLCRTPDGEWYCFEINPSPGCTYYAEATGQPIAGLLSA